MDESLVIENNNLLLGVPFTKVNTETRTVEGFATLDNVDKAKDILDINASKEAFTAWPGNIREMHQKKAVGKAINFFEKDYEKDGQELHGIWLQARISKGAEDTWQKVLDGTLSGFSVGGAIQEKEREMAKDAQGYEQPVWRVTKYSLGEVSLVDNPCNGLATIQLVKSADGLLEYTDIVDDGELEKAAMPNQRPPMKPTQPMQAKQQATVQPGQEQAPEVKDDDMPLIQAVIKALNAWRESESQEGDDHDIAFISSLIQQLKERVFNGDPGNTGNNAAVFGDPEDAKDGGADEATEKPKKKLTKDADGDSAGSGADGDGDADDESTHATVVYPAQHLIHARNHMRHFQAHAAKKGHSHLADQAGQLVKSMDYMHKDVSGYESMNKIDISDIEPGSMKKDHEMEGEILQDNVISDIPSVEDLSDEHKGVIRKFVEFLHGTKDEKTAVEEPVEKDGDITEMDEKQVTEAIETAVGDLNKSADDKFAQIGESLSKIAEALETVVKTDAIDELRTGLEATIEDLKGRLDTLENSGATQKSADEAGEGEKLEKNDNGFWGASIVPEFAQARHKAGR